MILQVICIHMRILIAVPRPATGARPPSRAWAETLAIYYNVICNDSILYV